MRQYGARFDFWKATKKVGTCVEWMMYIKPNGYGQIWNGKRTENAHRFSFRENVGPIPRGMLVCHRCDNRRCVRPSHLFLGTHADNLRDMDQKGRANRPRLPGEMNGNAKLTLKDVRYIRANYKKGTNTMQSFASRFGVTEPLIRHIIKGRAWRHAL